MPHRSRADRIQPDDRTPAGRLHEAGLQTIIGYQLAQATICTNAVFADAVGQPLGLRRVEFTVLMLIRDNPGCTSGRLARALQVTAPNITAWIGRLEQAGLVVRATSSADRRANQLALTPAGQALAADATRRVLDGEARLAAALTAAERAMLLELLHKLALQRPG